VYRRDAPMPEWYMNDNRVAVPDDPYPTWRAKNRYSMICGEQPTFEACQKLRELGEDLGHEATLQMAKELRKDIAEFATRFRKTVSSLQPSELINGKWYSKHEVLSES